MMIQFGNWDLRARSIVSLEKTDDKETDPTIECKVVYFRNIMEREGVNG